jgi:hypothetical protein
MKLLSKRIYKAPTYTISHLYIDGVKFCDVLEDVVRADGVKVYGETSIPSGTYKVILNVSNRFKCLMPLLLNVPNFEGIRIHSGNTDKDTHGCLLVGVNSVKGKVIESKKTFAALMEVLKAAKDEITIEIV